MNAAPKSMSKKLPLHAWPLVPFAFCAALVVMIPLGILALLSIPYYFVFPEHHRQVWDFKGTTHQRKLLEIWRSKYAKLSFIGRISRAFRKRRIRNAC